MDKQGVLKGLRVVDFGQYIAGPLAALILGDYGADVIHIDPPGGPRWDGYKANAVLARGKRNIILDLKKDEDLAIDCFMKGYSNALQMETQQYVEKRIETIFKNIFDIEGGYYTECTKENQEKWMRFLRFETMLKRLAYRKDKQDEKARKALAKLLENSGFDRNGPIEERLKIL